MKKAEILNLNGNQAVAKALTQINPDVFGFYPITPTSYIGADFSREIADGQVDTEYVCAESEHGAMSVCVGAAAAGGRAVTATASQGLILMSEVLWNAAGMRLPIMLINGNREVGAPLSIHCGHSDIMGVRDSGWIQLFAKNPQEAYDFTLCGFPIAENEKVRTPIMVAMDCFHTTHTQTPVKIYDTQEVKNFVGETVQIDPLLDIKNPVAYGNFDRPQYFMKHKRDQLAGLQQASPQAKKVFANFAEISGAPTYEVVETNQNADAEIVFVALGSVLGTVENAVAQLRQQNIKAGNINPRLFRPFPQKEVVESLKSAKKIIVLDRVSPSGGAVSPLMQEVLASVNLEKNQQIKNFIYGLGSYETTAEKLVEIAKNFDNFPNGEWIF